MAGVKVMLVGELYYTDLSVGGGPIYPPAQPPGIWGGAPIPVPTPPIYYPPNTIWPPGFPTHPIVLPPPGGGAQPPNVIWPSPGVPTHPIYLPPTVPGGPPNVIWPSPGVPTHPIVLPPEPPDKPPEPPAGGGKGNWTYVPGLGWVWYAEGGRWIFVAGDKPQPPFVPDVPGVPPGAQPKK